MKSFKEIGQERALVRYIGSEFGTMYFEPKLPREEKRITRYLDGKLNTELLPIYEEFYNTIILWIDNNPNVSEYVFLPPLIEVGKDYFIRRFYVYDIAIRDYFDKEDEDYVEPPELFNSMLTVVSKELKETSGKEGVIQRVLKRSLLEPSGKTIFGYRVNKFIIVEPKISLQDLQDWKELNQEA